MRMRLSAVVRRLGWVGVLSAVAGTAHAMEDESIYSATVLEAAAGKVRGQSGSSQRLSVDGWAGSDVHRLWYQLDADRSAGRTESAELQLLYGRYFAPFWDAQVGIRRDLRPGKRTYFVAGVRGLAPYAFDVDLKLFIRADGKVSARTRLENEFLLTNRLILTPSLGVEWSASNLDATIRRGAYQVDFGLQARYEFNRRLAPYVSVNRSLYPRARLGGDAATTQWQAGLRVLF